MFALSKLARKPGRVKPSSALAVRNHSGRIGNKTGSGGASGNSQRTNLNDSNRPVRIRMPGGVGGDRSAYAGRPYPDSGYCEGEPRICVTQGGRENKFKIDLTQSRRESQNRNRVSCRSFGSPSLDTRARCGV